MSMKWKAYCDITGLDPKDKECLKLFYSELHETPLNKDGSINYVTEQSCKDECNVNVILKKYPNRVLKARLERDELQFADVTGMDFQKSMNLVRDTEVAFSKLPSDVRAKFRNDIASYLDFLARETKAADQVDEIRNEPKKVHGKDKTDKKVKEVKEKSSLEMESN